MPAALADLIRQQRTQEPVEDMYDTVYVCDITLVLDNFTSTEPPYVLTGLLTLTSMSWTTWWCQMSSCPRQIHRLVFVGDCR